MGFLIYRETLNFTRIMKILILDSRILPVIDVICWFQNLIPRAIDDSESMLYPSDIVLIVILFMYWLDDVVFTVIPEVCSYDYYGS